MLIRLTPNEVTQKSVTTEKTWCTPPDYVQVITGFFGGIDLDPCWHPESSVVAQTCYFLPDHDGLKDSWDFHRIYVNPPYGHDKQRGTHLREWLQRCVQAHKQGSEVVALIPVATNTRHWGQSIFEAAQSVCFIREPRIKFSGLPKGAPMACAFVYWGERTDTFSEHFKPIGYVVPLPRNAPDQIDEHSRYLFELAMGIP